MPYAIRRKGTRHQVVNTKTGEVKAESTSKSKANQKLRLLKGIERGWTATDEPDVYTRTINGKQVRLHVGGNSGKAKR